MSLNMLLIFISQLGQAMRLALNFGLHTDIKPDRFGNASVERIRRAWWTVYILDREMTSVAGLPQSLEIQDVYCQLPAFSGSITRTSALKMQLKLSQLIADINRSMLTQFKLLRLSPY